MEKDFLKAVVKNAVRDGLKKCAVKNSYYRVEYVKDGLNKSKAFSSYEEAEQLAKGQELKKGDPWGSEPTKEDRITSLF